MEKKIDVIIPAYKAQDTIAKTLASLAMQNMSDEIRVTIVNDCDGIGYNWFVETFESLIDVDVINLETNGGPGVARRVGLERTSCPYVMFIDADDTLTGPYAIETMYKQTTTDEKTVVSVGTFYEVMKDGNYVKHSQDLVWMFAKMYKRSFLDKYQITFNDTRANEDTGFNTKVRLCSNDDEMINMYDTLVYYWNFKEDSITRINNFEYTYKQSFLGYIDNMIDAISHARKVCPNSKHLEDWTIQVIGQCYVQLLRILHNRQDLYHNAYQKALTYYQQIYFGNDFDEKKVAQIVSNVYEEQIIHMRGILPQFTFHDMMNSFLQDTINKEGKEEA